MISLRLTYRKPYVDSFYTTKNVAMLIPVKSVQSIHFQLTYISFEQFKRIVPILFPNAKSVDIECEDNDFRMLLKKRFGRKLNTIR